MTDELKKIIFSRQISKVFSEHNWVINTDSKSQFHSHFVGDIADYYLNVHYANGKINLDLKAENSIFKLSFEELTKVFVNLLENSIKYSKNNPEIYIKTRNYNKKLEIVLSDKGMGMSNKVKSKIFDKFYRIPQGNIHNVKGHGLGLSFVKKIIDLHNGTISVNSELGVGSSFKIIFDI